MKKEQNLAANVQPQSALIASIFASFKGAVPIEGQSPVEWEDIGFAPPAKPETAAFGEALGGLRQALVEGIFHSTGLYILQVLVPY